MRIMTDTNILVSAILFPNSMVKKILERIVVGHSVGIMFLYYRRVASSL